MKRAQKRKRIYIKEEERRKCRRVMKAFAELYQGEDIAVLDAGKYGFVKLQCYNAPQGFGSVSTFTDSEGLFKDLWKEWRNTQLLALSKNMQGMDLEYRQIFQRLPQKHQKKIMRKKIYFSRKAGKRGRGKGRLQYKGTLRNMDQLVDCYDLVHWNRPSGYIVLKKSGWVRRPFWDRQRR